MRAINKKAHNELILRYQASVVVLNIKNLLEVQKTLYFDDTVPDQNFRFQTIAFLRECKKIDYLHDPYPLEEVCLLKFEYDQQELVAEVELMESGLNEYDLFQFVNNETKLYIEGECTSWSGGWKILKLEVV